MYISKRKNGFYFVEYIDPITNKIRRKTTKVKRKQEAILFLKEFEKELDLSKKNPQKMLSEFAAEYSDFVRNTFSKKYLSSVQLSFRKMIENVGNIRMTDITIKDTQRFLTETHQRTKRGAELYHRTLKAAFNRAIEWDYITSNPFLKIRLPRSYRSHPIFINKNELDIILTNTQENLLTNIFLTAFYTGMRLGEIVNMKWNWIDLDRGIITVLHDQNFANKGKKDRIIPMVNAVKDIFLNHSRDSTKLISIGYVFTRIPGIKFNEDYISRKFKIAVRKSNLSDKVHFHTLRHSFASYLVQQGVDLYVVKELLGHEDVRTTQIYSHLQSENLFNAIKLLD
jgi:site-specific recombinase XerD